MVFDIDIRYTFIIKHFSFQDSLHWRLNMQATNTLWDIFVSFLKLGLTSFGGPIAHIGYFRDEFVTRRKWITEQDYADLVALCQFLPGPASSQVGMALGMMRAHYLGALVAWIGFTIPSALLLIGFALSLHQWGDILPTGVIHGLKIVAVAVVAQAVWGMAKTLCNSVPKVTLMALSVMLLAYWTSIWSQVLVIALGGVIGIFICKITASEQSPTEHIPLRISRKAGTVWGVSFLVLLFLLPALAISSSQPTVMLFDSFFRAGSLVFGGGHVVLPLLQAEVVPNGLVNPDSFMAGYGAAQAVPGPLFTFAAFLGASMQQGPTGIVGGLIALVAIFIPAFMVLVAVLPFWHAVRTSALMQAVMAGVGASVVGILLSALYNPIWTSSIKSPLDFAAALVAFVALMHWKLSPWVVVLSGGIIGAWLFN
ncbi:chromate efflux transporter [Shewanella baltica]|uniref:chromate efflux transporter n=2 Tax=Shewanella TaxID=22 RepID=UPI003D7A8840